MQTAILIILILMILTAGADAFISISRKKKIIVIPIKSETDIKELLTGEIVNIPRIERVIIVNMGMKSSDFDRLRIICEKNKKILCGDKNDILTML